MKPGSDCSATASALPQWADAALLLLRARLRPGATRLPPWVGDLPAATLHELAVRDIDSMHHWRFAPDGAAQRLYEKFWNAQRKALAQLLGLLAALDITPILFKGAELISRYYDGRALGLLHDVDLLVRRDELETVRRVLYKSGYAHGAYDVEQRRWLDGDALQVARIELGHYELFPFQAVVELELAPDELAVARRASVPDGVFHLDGDRALALVSIDVHHGIKRDLDVQPLLARAVPSAVAGAVTFCPTDHLWFTLRRYYIEVAQFGKRSLRQFAYLAALVASGDIDWELLVRVAEEHDARPSVYYWLRFLDELADGAVVPAPVLERVSPLRGGRKEDFGWMVAPLFGTVDPIPVALPPVTSCL